MTNYLLPCKDFQQNMAYPNSAHILLAEASHVHNLASRE